MKDSAAGELLAAVRALRAGHGWFGPQAARALAEQQRAPSASVDPYGPLTLRGSAAIFIGAPATTVATSLGGNTVTNNSSLQAIYYQGGTTGEVPPNIANNSVYGNTGGASTNQVAFSGILNKSATWETPTAPLYIEGAFKVPSGITLALKPGVTLRSGTLTVEGTLKAEGTAEAPVAFKPATEGGKWGGIVFKSGSSGSVLDHAEIVRAGPSWGNAIEIKESSPTITHSTIRESTYFGIYVNGGSPEVAHNTFNGGSIAFYASAETGKALGINFHDNLVEKFYGSAAIFIGAPATTVATSLGGNTVTNNSSLQAIYYQGGTTGEVPPNIANNSVYGNTGGASTNQVAFSGILNKSATWETPTAPLYIEGAFKVPSGITLALKPGVTLRSGTLTVEGTLKAEGTAEAPVAFKPATEGGKWGGIVFKSGSSGSVLDHAEIVRAGPSWGNAIEIKESSPTITHSTIRESTYFGIYVNGGSPEVAHNTFNGGSIAFYASAETGKALGINFHDNLVEKFYGSAAIFIGAPATTVATSLGGNTVTNNSSLQAIYYQGGTTGEVPPNIANNSVYGNTGGASTNQVAFSGILNKSATWETPTAPLYLESELKIASSATLTLKPGVTIHGGSMKVSGTLKAEGEPSKLVVFEPRSESSHCGSIVFEPGSGSSVLDHTEIYRCTGGTNGGAIEAKGSSPTITNSTVRDSSKYGIMVLESGSPNIKWDRFRGNTNGLSYSGTGILLAPSNDWGCASGPSPAGCGNSVTANVKWKPAVQLPELAGHCRGKESQCGEGADPVSLATGQLAYSYEDLRLANKSVEPLKFTRTYSSGSSSDTGLGPGWSQTGLVTATELESGEVLVMRQDGRQDLFQKAGSGYNAPSGVTDVLAKVEGTFQLTTLEGTIYRFDESGRIASITDDHGLKTTYAYNSEGRLATITDPSSQTLTLAYNGSNHITLVKDSTGREVKFGYSVAGDLGTVTDVLGGVTKYAYDVQHRLISITDPRSNVILKNVYDGQGRIVEQRDGLENLWKLEYKEGETVVTEPEGGKLSYGFDGQDRVVSEKDQLGYTTTTSYDEAGNVDEVVKPGGAKWQFAHDADGNLTSVIDPEAGERSYEYDVKNRLTSFTDEREEAWAYEWSETNDLKKITDPAKGETTFTYNASGQSLTATDPNEHTITFTYDTRGNRLTAKDALEHTTSFGYDSRNYLTSKTAPGLKAEAFERNALGDLLARTTPMGNKTKYAYDANGVAKQIIDPAENVWKIELNAMERPTAYVDPLGKETKIEYDRNFNPVKVTDRRGKATTYAYDLANHLTGIERPEGGDWEFGYHARGNRIEAVDPRENVTSYEYDLLDRMTEVAEPWKRLPATNTTRPATSCP